MSPQSFNQAETLLVWRGWAAALWRRGLQEQKQGRRCGFVLESDGKDLHTGHDGGKQEKGKRQNFQN